MVGSGRYRSRFRGGVTSSIWAKLHQYRVGAFSALSIYPEHARERIINHAARLQAMGEHAQASWSREENIHLTLKFLGEIQTSRLQ